MAYPKKEGKLKGVQKQLTVKWIVVNKKIIKFIEEEDKTYKLADNVLDYLEEIKVNVPVNVTINDNKVIFIQKIEEEQYDESEDENPENESKDNSNSELQTYTIKAISKTRDYYLFEETDKKEWFTIAKNIKTFLKDVKKGDILEVKIEISNDGKKDIKTVIFAKIKASKEESISDKTPTEVKTEMSSKKSSYRDEEATDKRTAIMTAKDIVVALLNNEKIENNQIKEVLKDLTKNCYEAIQSL